MISCSTWSAPWRAGWWRTTWQTRTSFRCARMRTRVLVCACVCVCACMRVVWRNQLGHGKVAHTCFGYPCVRVRALSLGSPWPSLLLARAPADPPTVCQHLHGRVSPCLRGHHPHCCGSLTAFDGLAHRIFASPPRLMSSPWCWKRTASEQPRRAHRPALRTRARPGGQGQLYKRKSWKAAACSPHSAPPHPPARALTTARPRGPRGPADRMEGRGAETARPGWPMFCRSLITTLMTSYDDTIHILPSPAEALMPRGRLAGASQPLAQPPSHSPAQSRRGPGGRFWGVCFGDRRARQRLWGLLRWF
jgi:hypothetical protein